MASPRKKWLRMKAREDAVLAAATITAPITTILAAEAASTTTTTTSKTKTRSRRTRTTKKG